MILNGVMAVILTYFTEFMYIFSDHLGKTNSDNSV